VTLKSAITAVFHGPDGDNVAGRAAQHFVSFFADRFHFPRFHFSVGLLDSHDRGLIDDDAFAFGIGQSIGGAEVNREISGEQAKQRAEFHVSPSG